MLLIGAFQVFVIKKNIPKLKKVLFGVVLVIVGLTFFLMGLEQALFPIGEIMAEQLSNRSFISGQYSGGIGDWQAYCCVHLGSATTIAEPSLYAIALKANEVSGGTIGTTSLRVVVPIGVAFALVLGTYRIVVGDSLVHYILAGCIVVIIQTIFVKKDLVALAYDSGGVTTSTSTSTSTSPR